MPQLTELSLANNSVSRPFGPDVGLSGGWKWLPRQLLRLDLGSCKLQQIPAELVRLTRLTQLSLRANPIEGGWLCLPEQLVQLDLTVCGLTLIPAELQRLARLTELCLRYNRQIKGATWSSLPPQLLRVDLRDCGLDEVPALLEARGVTVLLE